MPLTDSIREPLTEMESLIPGLAPTFAPQLPGIPTNKTLLYQTPGSSENSEQPNLIETAKPPKSEFSRAETDAFITNKASDTNSTASAKISELRTNSNPRDAANSEIDPLIGKLDSDSGDPLTNPNRITSPVITTSTTSEKASDKTPLPATAETSSKPEDKKTPLSSEATLFFESEPNKTSPATASTIIPDRSTTSSEKSETIAASPNIPSTDQTSTDKQSPVAKADDKIDSDKQSQNSTIVEKANSGEPSRTAEVSDKIDFDREAPIAPTSETKNSDKQLPVAEASTLIDSDKKSPTVDAIPTEKLSSNSQEPPTKQPPTASLIPAASNPVLPDTNISAEVNSADSTNLVQTASQALTDKQNDSEKVDPLKTEPAAIP